jgi:tetratricopeptide (TPR) repeat protein
MLSVDWNAVNSALQQSRDGNHLEAIAALSTLMSHCDSNRDRAAILLGQSSCYSRLGNIAKARELLESARMCAIEDRDLLSQLEMSEGSLLAQGDDYESACAKFASVRVDYADLLAQPDNEDFALELNSRLACALVSNGKYSEAIQSFEELFKHDKLDDKQRLQLHFGVALLRVGKLSEAQPHLFEAMSGSDSSLAQSASDYLSKISSDPHLGRRVT